MINDKVISIGLDGGARANVANEIQYNLTLRCRDGGISPQLIDYSTWCGSGTSIGEILR